MLLNQDITYTSCERKLGNFHRKVIKNACSSKATIKRLIEKEIFLEKIIATYTAEKVVRNIFSTLKMYNTVRYIMFMLLILIPESVNNSNHS